MKTSQIKSYTIKSLSLVALCFCMLLSSCAYKLATEFPSVIGDGTKTVKIKGVDNPTLDTTIAYILRSRLREEITVRDMAQWVDSGPADYQLEIKIKQFSDRGETFDDNLRTRLYAINLTVNLEVYDGSTNKKIWESGNISESDFSELPNSKAGTNEIATLLMRKIADRMKQKF